MYIGGSVLKACLKVVKCVFGNFLTIQTDFFVCLYKYKSQDSSTLFLIENTVFLLHS